MHGPTKPDLIRSYPSWSQEVCVLAKLISHAVDRALHNVPERGPCIQSTCPNSSFCCEPTMPSETGIHN